MDSSLLVQRYAVIKLYPGQDETIFQKLLNSLGLDVVFTNDLVDCKQIEKEIICANSAETPISQVDEKQLINEDTPLVENTKTNENVNMVFDSGVSCTHEVTVQCSVGEPITLAEITDPMLTCMLCQAKVPGDKKSLRIHVQTHSGKRYGCNRCQYYTDRKFDFIRHLRRRHEGEPDPAVGLRPHWMTMLHSCFPSYVNSSKLPKIRRSKITSTKSTEHKQKRCEDRSLVALPTAADCSTIIC